MDRKKKVHSGNTGIEGLRSHSVDLYCGVSE